MKTRISGASDDLVEIEGDHPDADEIDATADRAIEITLRADPELAQAPAVVITMAYVDPGVWQATIRQLAEGVPLLPCTVAHNHHHSGSVGYSVEVEVEHPEGTALTWRPL